MPCRNPVILGAYENTNTTPWHDVTTTRQPTKTNIEISFVGLLRKKEFGEDVTTVPAGLLRRQE